MLGHTTKPHCMPVNVTMAGCLLISVNKRIFFGFFWFPPVQTSVHCSVFTWL